MNKMYTGLPCWPTCASTICLSSLVWLPTPPLGLHASFKPDGSATYWPGKSCYLYPDAEFMNVQFC
jgi:hypothetical protein